MDPWKRIQIYKELINQIRVAREDYIGIVEGLITAAEEEINAPPVYKCNYCCDTGCEDVRGYGVCRNGCPRR